MRHLVPSTPSATRAGGRRRRLSVGLLVLALGAALLPSPALARTPAPGSIDKTFGNRGKVITNLGGDEYGHASVLDANDRIVVAGAARGTSSSDFLVQRYQGDGALDSTFGTSGSVTTDFGTQNGDVALGIAIDADGKIVVAGSTFADRYLDMALARYNPDGSLDETFGDHGKVVFDLGGLGLDDEALGVAIDSAGRIVVAGYADMGEETYSTDVAVARLTSSGVLDSTFDGDGKVTKDLGSDYDAGEAVAVDSADKIVVAGGGSGDMAVLRFGTDGSLDATFDSDGKVLAGQAGGDDYAWCVRIKEDGKILVGGAVGTTSGSDLELATLNENGTLDTDFGTGGIVVTTVGGRARSFGIAFQGDGKIVVAGSTVKRSSSSVVLARYASSGSIDPTFGSGGFVVTSSGAAEGVGIQAGGKIVIAGWARGSKNSDVLLVRYNP